MHGKDPSLGVYSIHEKSPFFHSFLKNDEWIDKFEWILYRLEIFFPQTLLAFSSPAHLPIQFKFKVFLCIFRIIIEHLCLSISIEWNWIFDKRYAWLRMLDNQISFRTWKRRSGGQWTFAFLLCLWLRRTLLTLLLFFPFTCHHTQITIQQTTHLLNFEYLSETNIITELNWISINMGR